MHGVVSSVQPDDLGSANGVEVVDLTDVRVEKPEGQGGQVGSAIVVIGDGAGGPSNRAGSGRLRTAHD